MHHSGTSCSSGINVLSSMSLTDGWLFCFVKECLGLGFRLGFGVFPVLFVIKGGFRDKSGFYFVLTGSSLSFSSGDLPLDELELESPSSDSSPVL